MATKTYILLPCMDADAPIFQQTADNKRVQVKKIPFHRPTLRQTFYDENGVSKTIRYKSNAVNARGESVIDQRTQMDELKIEANDPFTTQERKDLMFRYGILVTNKKIVQDYAEAHPEFEGFIGTCDDVSQPRYKLLDNASENRIKNSDIRKRVKAANKVVDLTLEEAQAMLIRLNGSFFTTPMDLEECQNLLMDFVDDAEEGGLNAVLKDDDDATVDEKTTVLIGKLINAERLSFDAVEGKISKKDNDNKWITIRDMSAEYSMDERKRLFSDFLNTDDGKALKNDLQNDLAGLSESIESKQELKRMGRPPKTN